MIWENPFAFGIPVIVLFTAIWFARKQSKLYAPIRFSDLPTLKQNWRTYLSKLLPYGYFLALISFGIAIARPQIPLSDSKVKTEGIDVMLVLDVSLSMLAKDFQPDRFRAAQEVAKTFIRSRPNDRIGLVIFGEDAFTQCPLTIDHDILIKLVNEVQPGMLSSGTGIGIGLATAVNRLANSKAKSRVVVLMTDGVNNAGDIDPNLAAQLAISSNIRVHTIGIGSKGEALSPVSVLSNGEFRFGMLAVEIDEELMQNIAQSTGGEYFRATDNKALTSIYSQIDAMEKSRVELSSISRVEERFHLFVFIGICLIIVCFGLQNWVCKTVN